MDKKGADYDLETDPKPEHALEIITLRSAAQRESVTAVRGKFTQEALTI
jgi:hypothetical protein